MRKILLIEDNKNLREILKELLESWSYQVITAKDGREGIDIFKRNSTIDFVITDFRMPRMNGIEVIRYVKLYNPSIKTILFTTYDLKLVRPKAEAAGADRILSKSDFDRLQKTLRGFIMNP